MEIRVFNTVLEHLGVIDEIASLIWTAKYWNVGEFKLLVPITDNNSKLLIKNNILIKHDNKNEVTTDTGTWRQAAQITYRHITKDENGQEQLEIQGYFLSKWLSKRVIKNQIVLTATNQSIINTHIANNVGHNATSYRKLPQFITLAQENLGGTTVEYSNEKYVDLGLEIHNRAIVGKLGYDILVNEKTKEYGFYLYKGSDLTSGNNDGNTPCIFSRDFDNVQGQEYTESIENIKNYIFVQGAADVDGNQPVVEIDGGSSSGLGLDEVFIEASDIARSYTENEVEITIPLATYLEMLKTRGTTELDGYVENINFISTINTNSNLKYKEDFKLGDRITCIEKSWGIRIDARITEIQEIYQKEKEQIEATFGESLPTLVEKIRKVR